MAGRTPEALIKPDLLVWARETSGLSLEEAAKKIGVAVDRLKSWEAGEARPTVRQLQTAARVYRRPFAAFYLPQPPKDFRVPHDFRRLPDSEHGRLSPALRSEIRRVQFQRQVALELAEPDISTEVEFLGSITLGEHPEAAAERARSLLGVDFSEQREWPDKYAALNGWRAALERNNVLVFQLENVDVSEMRGFSIPHREYPIAAANAKDDPHGRIFTLMHEFGHLLLNTSGLCNLEEVSRPRTPDQRVERFCNAFAAALLMPADALRGMLGIGERPRPQEWTSDDLTEAGRLFGVSREAVLRRLVTLGAASMDLYLGMREKFRVEYERMRDEQKEKKPKGGPSPAVSAVSRCGPAFTRLVLDAYDREDITTADLSEYLGVRVKHVPRIRELAEKYVADEVLR